MSDREAGAWILQADAFALPFRAGTFDVVVADPPYEVARPAGKALGGKTLRDIGYVDYVSREWWAEARRVLRPAGHLYVFAVIKELPAWYAVGAPPDDVIAWVAPNAAGVQSMVRRMIGGRSLAWRPILHWGPRLQWAPGEFLDPNYCICSQVQANMAEAEPWPNQLPHRLVTWLLRPHRGATVLDLFAGTGTGRASAMELGLEVVSVDKSPQALALTRARPVQFGLFAGSLRRVETGAPAPKRWPRRSDVRSSTDQPSLHG